MKDWFTKKNIIIGSICLAVIIAIVVTIIIVINSGKNESKIISIYDSITVDNLTFDNGNISEENGLYLYSVDITNNNKKEYKMNYITVYFYDENNKEIASLVGYAKDKLDAGETFTLNTNIDIDIRDAKNVKVVIEK